VDRGQQRVPRRPRRCAGRAARRGLTRPWTRPSCPPRSRTSAPRRWPR
jgi:hypothetical protein